MTLIFVTFCSSLGPTALCAACVYKVTAGRRSDFQAQPVWFDKYAPGEYSPSYNLAPSSFGPVLLSSDHHKNDITTVSRCIQPMKWGLLPSWYKGSPEDFNLKMNNARSDGLMDKASFRNPLTKGQRCVVLADGFYEWSTDASGKKHPHFITFPKKEIKPEAEMKTDNDDCLGSSQFPFGGLLTMAGIFDVWIDRKSSESYPLFTYSVITVPASKPMSALHHRMPAILTNDLEIDQWLNFRKYPLKQALELIRPVDDITFYEVSTLVNKTTNNSPDCIKPLIRETTGTATSTSVKSTIKRNSDLGSCNIMLSWLQQSASKKPRLEDKTDLKHENI